jgi:hypothetical protein
MKRATKYPASTVLSRLAALLLLATGAAAFATDTYNGGALSIPPTDRCSAGRQRGQLQPGQ